LNAEDNSDVVADSVCDFIHRAEESGRSRASRARRNCVPATLRVDRAKPFVTVRGGAYFFPPGLRCAISPPRHDLEQCRV
jgi:hypothetical protein